MNIIISIAIWILLFLFGTLFIYNVCLIQELNNIREKNNLLNPYLMNKHESDFLIKECHDKYKKTKKILFFLSLLISFIITSINWLSHKDTILDNIEDIILILFPIILTYSVLYGTKNNYDTENIDLDMHGIQKLKTRVLNHIINEERKLYHLSIQYNVSQWYESNDKNIFIAFIIRLEDRIFVDLIKEICEYDNTGSREEQSIKTVILEKPIEIIESYCENDPKLNVLSSINWVFDECFKLDPKKYCKFIKFLATTEISIKNETEEKIEKKFNNLKERHNSNGNHNGNPNENRELSDNDLNTMMNDL